MEFFGAKFRIWGFFKSYFLARKFEFRDLFFIHNFLPRKFELRYFFKNHIFLARKFEFKDFFQSFFCAKIRI